MSLATPLKYLKFSSVTTTPTSTRMLSATAKHNDNMSRRQKTNEEKARDLFLKTLLHGIRAPVHLLPLAVKEDIAAKAKTILLYQRVDFLGVPREIRDMIYHEHAKSYPTFADVVHCCAANPTGQTCFICTAIPKSPPYTSTTETRAHTNYGMLLVNKACCAEFLEAMTSKDHARHVFHVSLERSAVFAKYCDNLDVSTLGYRCKIMLDYDGNLSHMADRNNVVTHDKYRDLVTGLPEFAASIPNIRNVEIVHVNQYAERKMYAQGQNWPALLRSSANWGIHLREAELAEDVNFRAWMRAVVAVLDNFVVSPPDYVPLPFFDDQQVTLETHLVLKPLDILDKVATIRSVRIRAWNAVHGAEHRFERTVDNGTFERVFREGQLDGSSHSRVLLRGDGVYRFCTARRTGPTAGYNLSGMLDPRRWYCRFGTP